MNSKYAYIFRMLLAACLVYLGGRILYEMVTEKPTNMGAMAFLAVLYMAIGIVYAVCSMKKIRDILKEKKAEEDLGETQELPVFSTVQGVSQSAGTPEEPDTAENAGVKTDEREE